MITVMIKKRRKTNAQVRKAMLFSEHKKRKIERKNSFFSLSEGDNIYKSKHDERLTKSNASCTETLYFFVSFSSIQTLAIMRNNYT